MPTSDPRLRGLYGRPNRDPAASAPAAAAAPEDRLSRLLARCHTIDVGIRPIPSGGVEAVAPAVPDCTAAGESRDQALTALRGLVIGRVGEAVAAPPGDRAGLRSDPRFADCAWTQMVVVLDRATPR